MAVESGKEEKIVKTADYSEGSYPWQPDNGDGTYTNPVLFADYSDPDVIRVGEDFYLTASSFNQSPGLQWAAQGALKPEYYSLTERPGWLRLNAVHRGRPELHTAPHVLIQKTPCRMFTVETEIDFQELRDGVEAGLAVLGLSTASISLFREDGKTELIHRLDDELFMRTALPGGPVRLVLNFGKGGFCQFGWKEAGETQWFGPAFQAREGKWIGARVGLYCTALGPEPLKAHADFKYFRFS